MLRPRSVILIWDRWTRPEKPKRHLCICPDKLLFLRINSEPIFTPHYFLAFVNNHQILDHDSYVELRALFRNYPYEVDRSKNLGTMSQRESRALVVTARSVSTLNDEQKDFIAQQIG